MQEGWLEWNLSLCFQAYELCNFPWSILINNVFESCFEFKLTWVQLLHHAVGFNWRPIHSDLQSIKYLSFSLELSVIEAVMWLPGEAVIAWDIQQYSNQILITFNGLLPFQQSNVLNVEFCVICSPFSAVKSSSVDSCGGFGSLVSITDTVFSSQKYLIFYSSLKM